MVPPANSMAVLVNTYNCVEVLIALILMLGLKEKALPSLALKTSHVLVYAVSSLAQESTTGDMNTV